MFYSTRTKYNTLLLIQTERNIKTLINTTKRNINTFLLTQETNPNPNPNPNLNIIVFKKNLKTCGK